VLGVVEVPVQLPGRHLARYACASARRPSPSASAAARRRRRRGRRRREGVQGLVQNAGKELSLDLGHGRGVVPRCPRRGRAGVERASQPVRRATRSPRAASRGSQPGQPNGTRHSAVAPPKSPPDHRIAALVPHTTAPAPRARRATALRVDVRAARRSGRGHGELAADERPSGFVELPAVVESWSVRAGGGAARAWLAGKGLA